MTIETYDPLTARDRASQVGLDQAARSVEDVTGVSANFNRSLGNTRCRADEGGDLLRHACLIIEPTAEEGEDTASLFCVPIPAHSQWRHQNDGRMNFVCH